MRVCYDNLVKTATITAFTENPDYTFEVGLKDKDLSRFGRTVNDTNEWIKFSFASAKTASYVIIKSHNISAGATVKLQGNASDSWGAPTFDETLTYGTDIVLNFTESSFQYWRISIDDPSNPDDYIQIGGVFLGTFLQMPGQTPSQKLPRKSSAKAETSPSGHVFGDKRLIYKAASMAFPLVTNAQKDDIETFFNTVDKVDPFYLIMWEYDLTLEPPLYCNLMKDLGWNRKQMPGYLWTLSLEFKETF